MKRLLVVLALATLPGCERLMPQADHQIRVHSYGAEQRLWGIGGRGCIVSVVGEGDDRLDEWCMTFRDSYCTLSTAGCQSQPDPLIPPPRPPPTTLWLP